MLASRVIWRVIPGYLPEVFLGDRKTALVEQGGELAGRVLLPCPANTRGATVHARRKRGNVFVFGDRHCRHNGSIIGIGRPNTGAELDTEGPKSRARQRA